MDDSIGSPWLLLIHHLPPKPDYLRVKVRRRIERLGAIPLKSSVYVLPMRDGTLEDFQWLAREIAADGGEATVCGATFLEGTTDEELRAAFVAAREADYREIADAADDVGTGGEAALARLTRRLATVATLDWFDAPARAAAERAVSAAAERVRGTAVASATAGGPADAPRGRTWVTRAGVFVDRIASAWLVRRFIDPEARFAFTATTRYRPKAGEVRFDMFEAEYTHAGDRCTFEVLLDRFALGDPALATIGEMVHDIDLKDEKYGRAETAGVAAVLEGIAATTRDDAARLERGAALFDLLYATLRSSR
jgi:hypothetical protein